MIIAPATSWPFGGGTDLPSYLGAFRFLIAAAIDKYVYINVHRRFVDGFLLKYSSLEEAATIDDIKHPIIREALKLVDIHERNLEITSMADIPAGTGLGSSGSFTTALLKAFHALKKNLVHPAELAEQACCIELEKLGEPIGKQDQYISAYGGTAFAFFRTGEWQLPLKISEETLFNLRITYCSFTGTSRGYPRFSRNRRQEEEGRYRHDRELI
jgi:D-glycero-alpha-D-manno-heptose-7-phosphate kinase